MYDFDTPIDRMGTHSLKWDVAEGELPMWVADMDFAVCPEVQAALQAKLDTRVYGYQTVPAAFGEAVAEWWRTRHGWRFAAEDVIFCTGVVPALTHLVCCLSNVGDNVVVFTPVYNIFFSSIENMGRHVYESPLAYDGAYHIDWADLEGKLAHPNTTLMILCNPHNPTGQVWDKGELERIGQLCRQHGVQLVSDEIHCDLTLPDVRYCPYGSTAYGGEAVVCVAASKAFNLAALQGAAVVVTEPRLREKVSRALNAHEVAEPNLLAVEGTVAALRYGGRWLDELRRYLADNRRFVEDYLAERLPAVRVVAQRATYLMWLDVAAVAEDSAALCDFLRRTTGLWITAGTQYRGNGSHFVRVNIATQRANVADGMERFVRGVSAYLAEQGR